MVGEVVWFPCVSFTLPGEGRFTPLGRALFGLLLKVRGAIYLMGKTPSWPLRELRRPRKAQMDSEKIRSLLTPVNG